MPSETCFLAIASSRDGAYFFTNSLDSPSFPGMDVQANRAILRVSPGFKYIFYYYRVRVFLTEFFQLVVCSFSNRQFVFGRSQNKHLRLKVSVFLVLTILKWYTEFDSQLKFFLNVLLNRKCMKEDGEIASRSPTLGSRWEGRSSNLSSCQTMWV